MNRKGFTLTELLAVIVVLAIVSSISFSVINYNYGSAKGKTLEIFVKTIKDSMDIYLSSDARELNFSTVCDNKLHKTYGDISVYKEVINYNNVINSSLHPITQSDLVNPINKDVKCNNGSDIPVYIYRDDDYVYYYKIDKDSFGCLNNADRINIISNLPEGFDC